MDTRKTKEKGQETSQGVGTSNDKSQQEGTVALPVATAEIIKDSISPQGIRLTTMQLRYPRFIHAELMTHRVFSRNARSSRAVPASKLAAEDPYIPEFMRNQPGMQSFEHLTEEEQRHARAIWKSMIEYCQSGVRELAAVGVHKQWANRPLEWFGFIDVLVTSTHWANWYALRDHPAAMPEIQTLARVMKEAQDNSTPVSLEPGQWHLPYVEMDEEAELGQHHSLRISAARCARLSYKPFDCANADPQKDMELFGKLLVETPVHASPAEHQATPDKWIKGHDGGWLFPEHHGNFTGWRQFRKTLSNEAVSDDHDF